MTQLNSQQDWDRLPMRIGLGTFMHPTPERLRFIKQIGVDDILLNMYRNPMTDTDYDVLRSSLTYPMRGGAVSMSINLADFERAPLVADREYSEQEMWEYYHYFLEQVLPVAESEGIGLAVHPNDPPVPAIGGMPRLMRSRENYDKAFDLVPSEFHGAQLCLGNWAAMGEDILDVIDHFAQKRKIFYVHFQTISNALPDPLHEVFVDEPGYYNVYEVLKKLREVDFSGLIIPGHVPMVEGDGRWKERSRAFTAGYLKGILRAMDHAQIGKS